MVAVVMVVAWVVAVMVVVMVAAEMELAGWVGGLAEGAMEEEETAGTTEEATLAEKMVATRAAARAAAVAVATEEVEAAMEQEMAVAMAVAAVGKESSLTRRDFSSSRHPHHPTRPEASPLQQWRFSSFRCSESNGKLAVSSRTTEVAAVQRGGVGYAHGTEPVRVTQSASIPLHAKTGSWS